MGILQLQRRALEAMLSKRDLNRSFLVSGKMNYRCKSRQSCFRKIYLLGVSEGVGTCSDRHGINIAVFSAKRPEHFKNKIPEICQMAAILREPRPEEWKNHLSPRMVVEKIAPVQISEREIHFVLIRRKRLYLPL